MSRIVGLEPVPGALRVAWGERRLGGAVLRETATVPVPDGDALTAALRDVAARRPAHVLLALPAADGTHRRLVLPFRDARRLLAAAPLELAGVLPLPAEALAVAAAAVPATAEGGVALAAAVRRTTLDAARAALGAAGLAAARIDLAPLPAAALLAPDDPAPALVVADGPRSAAVVRASGHVMGWRLLAAAPADARTFAAELRWSLAALGAADGPLAVAGPDAAAAVDALAAAGTAARVLDAPGAAVPVAAGLVLGMGRGDVPRLAFGAPARGAPIPPGWRRVAALAAAAVVLALVDYGIVRAGLVRRADGLAAAAAHEAAAARPDLSPETARAALEASARPGAGAPGVLEALREVSARVPASLALDLEELVVDAEQLRVAGRCASFDAVETLRRALAASPQLADVTAEETRTTVDGTGVEFRLHARRRAAVGAPS